MTLKFLKEKIKTNKKLDSSNIAFSEEYADFLNKAGWRLERKLPSNNSNYYSDLLEDTDWKSSNINLMPSKHRRRDLDALS